MAKQAKQPTFLHCKVSRTTHARAPWRVFYTAEQEGKRVRLFKSFADEGKALDFAGDKDRETSNHGARYGDVPPEARRAFDFYRDESVRLRSEGAKVPSFEELVGGALKEIQSNLKRSIESDLPVAEAVAQFLEYKKARVKERQLANLTDQLKRFTTDHGTTPLSLITTATVEKWLSSLRSRRNPDKLPLLPLLAPLTRNHYRAALHVFFGYCCAPARALCSDNPVAALECETVETSEPWAYSPEDAAAIMQASLDHKPHLLPVLALGFFAGLRISEAVQIDLTPLKTGEPEFRVTKGKTGPRAVPFNDACKAWLYAQPRRRGKAWTQSPRSLVSEIQDLFALVGGVEQIDNGARHSFISYRCAETRDIAAVADECGNSVGTIKAHYRQLVTAAAAVKYFAIRPAAEAENVTGIEQGRASA